MKKLIIMIMLLVLAGCAVYARHQLDGQFGEQRVRNRVIAETNENIEYTRDVKSILDNRCVVCHACYDAPCQLKLSSFEGVDRGASKDKVYDGRRILNGNLSRLFIDAEGTQQWREQGFYPVLNEREQDASANLDASVMYRMLAMKTHHPLPALAQLGDEFDFALNRHQQCPNIEEFNRFEQSFPLWGMPYGLPGLNAEEFSVIKTWLQEGAKTLIKPPLPAEYQNTIMVWEQFLNGQTNKQKLMARYIYEHLFIANIYFPELPLGVHFRWVRSLTPSGEPIKIIASRRPYDSPGVENFYYRLQRVDSTITAKTHMPYPLYSQRLKDWHKLFIAADYSVNYLPSYKKAVASNPFITFAQLPVKARYRFMLEEAAFTINGFIKGPVCRGQIALNVIDDHFWVLFIEPDEDLMHEVGVFLNNESSSLSLPAENSSQTLPLLSWLEHSKNESLYLQEKQQLKQQYLASGKTIGLKVLWDGDGSNDNVALTVFRHFDSATVKKGLLGKVPKTAWVIGYPLLERIHYLLVSGFDVYGNAGHQLLTRLYMDFLRMEGERSFLGFLPSDVAKKELEFWYRDEEESVKEFINAIAANDNNGLAIDYKTDKPKAELFDLFQQNLVKGIVAPDNLNRPNKSFKSSKIQQQLQRLANFSGVGISYLPELLFIRIKSIDNNDQLYTLISNRARSNVLTLLREQSTLKPEEQTVSLLEGVVGSYPNVFVQVDKADIKDFVTQLTAINSEQDYAQLLDRFGVRRTSESFWSYSDWLNNYYSRQNPIEAGLLDYNRLENR